MTDPCTGGSKGDKPSRMDLIPPDVLIELGVHYGRGAEKYPTGPDHIPNWQLGYTWHLNLAALLRHLMAWADGEDTDEETGSNHLIAVAWHAFALRWFQIHDKGTDDIAGRQKARGLGEIPGAGFVKAAGQGTLDEYFDQFEPPLHLADREPCATKRSSFDVVS